MDASAHSWELIIVDDGSSDGSAEIAIADPRTRVIRAERNRGAGTARRIGTEAAKGDVVVWSDADMSYPNHQIPQLVDALGDADQVVGARTSEEGTLKFFRVPAKWLIRRLAQYLTQTKIPISTPGSGRFARRGTPVHPSTAAWLQLRHHHHDGVPDERLPGRVRADRLRDAGRRIEVPLVEGHPARCAAGHPDDAVL